MQPRMQEVTLTLKPNPPLGVLIQSPPLSHALPCAHCHMPGPHEGMSDGRKLTLGQCGKNNLWLPGSPWDSCSLPCPVWFAQLSDGELLAIAGEGDHLNVIIIAPRALEADGPKATSI